MSTPLDHQGLDLENEVAPRQLLICEWLGLDPSTTWDVDDTDPDKYGEVEVSWQSAAVETPTRGLLLSPGASGSGDELPVHHGSVWLYGDDAAAMLAVAGPKLVLFDSPG